MEVLKINGHDYSRFLQSKGYGWERNDLDSEKTTRTKDGKLRRYKITSKRKLSFKLMNMTRAELAALDNDLSAPTFSVTYFDLHGEATREFYCSSFKTDLLQIQDNSFDIWTGASFNIIEV